MAKGATSNPKVYNHKPHGIMTTTFSNKVQQAKLKKARKSAGISLVEMVVATSIMGVLSAVGLQATLGSVAKAAAAAANTTAVDAARACAVAIAEGETYTAPTGVTIDGTGCQLGATFTADGGDRATDAVATISTTGAVELTTESAPV